jgi:hypothetical protein
MHEHVSIPFVGNGVVGDGGRGDAVLFVTPFTQGLFPELPCPAGQPLTGGVERMPLALRSTPSVFAGHKVNIAALCFT